MYITLNFKKIAVQMFKCVFLYLYVYDIAMNDLSTLFSTKKIVFFLLAIFVFFFKSKEMKLVSKLKYSRDVISLVFLICVVLVYSILISLIQNAQGVSIIAYLIFFILYVPIGVLLFSCIFNDSFEFCNIFILSSLIPAVLIFVQQTSEEFRVFLDRFFLADENIAYLRNDRAAIPGASGATLTVWMFLAMFACAYLILLDSKKKRLLKYFICFMFFLCASVLSGSTGTLAGGALLIFLLFLMLKNKKIGRFGLYGVFLIVLVSIVISVFQDIFSIGKMERIYDRIFSVFESGVEQVTVSNLFAMKVPELNFNTVLGTGIVRGTMDELSCFHDSGYVQAYFALGLIVSVVFYFVVYSTLIKGVVPNNGRIEKWLMCFLIAVLFVIEIKEPFCLKYNAVFFAMLINLLSEKERVRENS